MGWIVGAGGGIVETGGAAAGQPGPEHPEYTAGSAAKETAAARAVAAIPAIKKNFFMFTPIMLFSVRHSAA